MSESGQDQGGNVNGDSRASLCSSIVDRLVAQDAEAWKEIVCLYYPAVRGWCRRSGLQDEDAADVSQEVFRALAGNVSRFRREERHHSFRGWLYGITQRQLLVHWRQKKNRPAAVGGSEAQQLFAAVPQDASDLTGSLSSAAMPDDRHLVLRQALQLLRKSVADHTWQAFWRAAVEGHAPADIAVDLGMNVNAVYAAKARVLSRLRQEFGELIDLPTTSDQHLLT